LNEASYRENVELDFRSRATAGTPAYFADCVREIDVLLQRVNEGVVQDPELDQLAVFAFARIPLLVHLGARIDDKIRANLYQRQRSDDGDAWSWPDDAGVTPSFNINTVRDGDGKEVAIVVNLSGTVSSGDLPTEYADATVYAVEPASPAATGPALINSPAALKSFEYTFRQLLANIERDHGRIDSIGIFGAIPLTAAVTIGRALMPDVSPALKVYDRDDNSKFFMALEVKK
ncbi:MAG: SAVED domain-containing protein, partial [Patescibacteria group bacterium]